MANLNNPVNVLYQDDVTGQPVEVTQTTPLPVTGDAAVLAILGSADDAPGDNTVMGQLKQIAANTAA